MEARATLDRGINTTDSEVSIVGPKDSFNENFNTNLGLIRRRLRTNELFLKTMFIGKNSNTKVGICYMNNIARSELVDKILIEGTEKARKIAKETMKKVKKAMKLDYFDFE